MKTRNKFSMAVVLACAMFAVASTTLARERSRPLKVLAIGNSFSYSLMAQLPECARALPGAELDFAMLVFKPPAKDEQDAFKDGEFPDMGGEPVGSYRWSKSPSWNKGAKDNDVYKLRCDSIHLNKEGQYLQACTWLAALFDDDLSRLDYKPDFLSDEKAALMRKCAVEAVKARKSPGEAGIDGAPRDGSFAGGLRTGGRVRGRESYRLIVGAVRLLRRGERGTRRRSAA